MLFATGIAVSGLLGIASLLLMAGRQASQSNRSVETQTLADDWYNEFLTRGMNNPSNWVWYRDFQIPGGGTEQPPQLKTFQKRQYTGSVVGRLTHSTGSRGGQLLRPLGKHSICLDPSTYSDRTLRATMPLFNEGISSVWYRPAVFPYYQDGYNPLTDSTYLVSTSQGLAWTDQPRMIRATLGSPGATMTEKHVQSMFVSSNELTLLISDKDKTLAPERGYRFMPLPTDPTVSIVAKGAHSAKYSWMATLSPLEQSDSIDTEQFYTLSLVVIHQRDKQFVDPSSFVERTSGESPSPESKPQGERLTWVVPLSGNFTGGNGGRVRLISSDGTKDTVNVGDWIMLSRHVSGTVVTTTSGSAVQAYSVFRWYRIIAAEAEPRVNNLSQFTTSGTDPFGNTIRDDVWARDVVLDGPDWTFFVDDPTTNGIDPQEIYVIDGVQTAAAPTTGTLVSGTIAVHERVVEIPDTQDF